MLPPDPTPFIARAITWDSGASSPSRDDDLRVIRRIGATFLGRMAHVWFPTEDDAVHFARAAEAAAQVHAIDPGIVCQAAIFEVVYPRSGSELIPEWVFTALGEPVEARTFRVAEMAPADGSRHWSLFGAGSVVPDLTRAETRRWILYRAGSYLRAGYEALHLGQVHMTASADRGFAALADLLGRIRALAATWGRRGFVLIDAHTHGVVREGRLLFDLHTRASSLRNGPVIGSLLYQRGGRSRGGIAPSGQHVAALPGLVEIDNWGWSLPEDRRGDAAARAACDRWGMDDISALAHMPAAMRRHFLRFAALYWRSTDQAQRFQPPLRRVLHAEQVEHLDGRRATHYQANRASPACPDGFGDEDTLAALWDGEDPPWLAEWRALPDRPVAPGGDAPGACRLIGPIQRQLGGKPGDPACPHSLLHPRGDGTFAKVAVVPWAGDHACAVAFDGTITEVYRQGGLMHSPDWIIRTATDICRVRIWFDWTTRMLHAIDDDGRSLIA